MKLTFDFGSAANFVTLNSENDNNYIEISDISSLGLTNIRPGYFPLKLNLDDGKDKVDYKTILLIIAAPEIPSAPPSIPLKICEP